MTGRAVPVGLVGKVEGWRNTDGAGTSCFLDESNNSFGIDLELDELTVGHVVVVRV
jgi:hypothetical protein